MEESIDLRAETSFINSTFDVIILISIKNLLMSLIKADLSDVKDSKLWGGRFQIGLDPLMEEFNASLKFDKRLYSADITGSIAYAKAIHKCGILSG